MHLAAPGETVLELDRVSLCYRLAKQRLPSFKDYAIHWVKGTLVYEKFWALSEVSFSVARGEVVGIVGRNGAGRMSSTRKPPIGAAPSVTLPP